MLRSNTSSTSAGSWLGGGGLQLVGLLADGDGHQGLPKSGRVDCAVQ